MRNITPPISTEAVVLYISDIISGPKKAKPRPAGIAISAVSFIPDSIFRFISGLSLLVHEVANTGNALTPKTDVIVGTRL